MSKGRDTSWGTADDFDAAMTSSMGAADETSPQTEDSVPADDAAADDAGTSSPDEEVEVETAAAEPENPFEESAAELVEKAVEDDRPVQNLKAEFDRKMTNMQSQFDTVLSQNQQLTGVIGDLRQMLLERQQAPAAPAPKTDPYAALDEDDPDYDVKRLQIDLSETRRELLDMRTKRQQEVENQSRTQQVQQYQRWVQDTLVNYVDAAVTGTAFSDNREVKARLWEAGYTQLGVIGGDQRRINEVEAAIQAARNTFDSIRKSAQEGAVRKVKTKPSGRAPIRSRGASSAVAGKKPSTNPAKMNDRDFAKAVDNWLETNLG